MTSAAVSRPVKIRKNTGGLRKDDDSGASSCSSCCACS